MATIEVAATGEVLEDVQGNLLAYYQGEANTVGGYTIDGVEYPARVDVPVEGEEGFDPADHTVPEVEEHLAESTVAEQERVLAAERDGKERKTLIGDDPDDVES